MTRELLFSRRMAVAGIVISAILVVAFFTAYRSLTKVRDQQAWVAHTQEVLRTIAAVRLERARLRNEVWTRRATGDPDMLRDFDEDARELRKDAPRLLSLTSDNPIQQKILNSMFPKVISQLQALQQAMNEPAKKERPSEVYQGLPPESLSPEDLRESFETVEANERKLLEARTATAQANMMQTRIILAIAAILVFAALSMAGMIIRREILARAEIERGLNAAQHLLGIKYEEQSVELRQVLSDLHAQIRARQAAEEDLRRANGELESRVGQRTIELQHINQELEAFTYSVSHDLRAPLRHMDGFSKILQTEFQSQLPEGARHYLERVRNAVGRMTALVDELLSLSRLGRQAVQKNRISLVDLVKEARNELAVDGRAESIDWKVGVLPTVDADPALLRQVLINLFSNAVKFTRDASRATIEIGSREEAEETVVYVRDNGAGFDPRYADKLFGVFQRLHRQDEFPGTGIGLAVVQRIVHKHNGRVWAESRVGQGACFYFSLPRVKRKGRGAVKTMGVSA